MRQPTLDTIFGTINFLQFLKNYLSLEGYVSYKAPALTFYFILSDINDALKLLNFAKLQKVLINWQKTEVSFSEYFVLTNLTELLKKKCIQNLKKV